MNFVSTNLSVLVLNVARFILYAFNAALFRSIISALELISFSECVMVSSNRYGH